MIGYGTLTIQDYEVLMTGTGSLTLSNPQTANVTMSGVGEMVATAASNYGYALFPPLAGFGGDITNYGAGDASFPSMQSYAEGGLYVPVLTNYGFVSFPKMVSSGILGTISYLDGDADFPAMLAKGGEGEYGEGLAEFPALVSSGIYDATPFERKLYSFCYTLDAFGRRPVFVVVLDNSGQIVDTITGSHIYISQLLASMQATNTFTVIGSFLASFDTSIITDDVVIATSGTTATINNVAALDTTARVWVVNMDTNATNQYDNYGYLSFYSYEGKNYGIARDGIYELTGDTDNGIEIDALVDFGKTDLGSIYKKRVTSAYLGLSSSGKLSLTVEADGQTRTFEMKDSSTTMTKQRVNMGSGLSGYYWNYVLTNNGYNFDLENIMLEIMQLNRRI